MVMKARKALIITIKAVSVVLITMLAFFPIYWMLITSLRQSSELISCEMALIPQNPSFQSFIAAFRSDDLPRYLMNTVIMTAGILMGQIVTGTLAAYGLAITKSKHKNLIFGIIMGAMMIPIQVTFIPLYMSFAKLKLTNSFWGLILPELASPFFIYVLKNAFENTNRELIDAGTMDGLSKTKRLLYVYLPEHKPKFFATVIILFINSWNSYFWPKIIVNSKLRRVLAVGIAFMKTSYGGDAVGNYNEIMAVSVVSTIPVLAVFIALHKYVSNGISV